MATTIRERPNPVDKHDARRRALAEAALRTLGELGYAKFSLREMATHSEFTHGVVHYYFADKLDLIVYCVQYYKATCVTRYDTIIEESTSSDQLMNAFAEKLCETIAEEAPMHRLWYDLRSQSMFEPGLIDAVRHIDGTLSDMIWRVLVRHAELARRVVAVGKPDAYGMLDGLFQQALLAHQRDPAGMHLAMLDRQVKQVVPMLMSDKSR